MVVLLAPGAKLSNGHYTVIKAIGVGAMGIVYQCLDESLLREVAVKVLLPELTANGADVEVFKEEARLAAQLEHPNIVTIFDVGIDALEGQTYHFLAMEYLAGGNLSSQLVKERASCEQSLNWMKHLASAVNFAHKRSVVHRDIKAENVFITEEGDLKIGDFGLARLLSKPVSFNAAKMGMGTPAYMSPELCRGESQDCRSDIYSLGVVFFEITTGQLPFQARDMVEMAMKHMNTAPPRLRDLMPEVPEELDQVVHRMMSKDPALRPQSAGDVAKIIDELIFDMRLGRLGFKRPPKAPQN